MRNRLTPRKHHLYQTHLLRSTTSCCDVSSASNSVASDDDATFEQQQCDLLSQHKLAIDRTTLSLLVCVQLQKMMLT